jgi:positive regulator of sigma E activity
MDSAKINEECVEGVVADVNPESFTVSMMSGDGCKSCGLNNICNQKFITLDRKDAPAGLQKGQKIQFEYDKVIQTSFLLYIVPMLFFIGGIMIAKDVLHISNEVIQFLSAFTATAVSFGIIRLIDKNVSKKKYHINVKVIN